MNKVYNELVKFHGHSCPGLAIGYRAALIAMENGFSKSEDEDLIAIVENNSCSVDAVQYLLSCTFGKGNLFYKDYGKQVFTIIKRESKDAIRISLKHFPREHLSRENFFRLIMDSKAEDIFNVKNFKISESEFPEKAKIVNSFPCDICNEPTMETRLKISDNKKLCLSCYKKIKN